MQIEIKLKTDDTALDILGGLMNLLDWDTAKSLIGDVNRTRETIRLIDELNAAAIFAWADAGKKAKCASGATGVL